MKVAIVGAGVAGLSAAWLLHDRHELRIYERERRPGGHAWTVDVGDEAAGDTVAIDVGFQLFHEQHNPNVRALLNQLGVVAEPVDFSISSRCGDEVWTNNGQRTRFGDAMAGERVRFMHEATSLASSQPGITLGQVLAAGNYSGEFRHQCLAPLLCFWWVSRAALFEMPAVAVAAGLVQGAISFFSTTRWSAIKGGSRSYVDRLVAPFAECLACETAVTRIERSADAVTVHDARGGVERFDQLIIAADASTALALLDVPTEAEHELLGTVRFEPATLVVHRDERVMPADRSLWSYGNYRALGPGSDAIALDGEMTYWQPRPGAPSIFVTVEAAGSNIDQELVVARRRWQHRIVDGGVWSSHRVANIQGECRTWFCGGHTFGFPVHEHALCSGIAVAEALGATYPFSVEADAVRSYQMFKQLFGSHSHHLR